MKSWQFWIGVLVSAFFIWFALSKIEDWGQFKESFLDADYIYIAPIVLSYFLAMLLRSWRWKYILDQSGKAGLGDVFAAILVCYMGNNVFPLRAGELMRVFLIAKQEPSISMSQALATVVVERLFDFIVMLMLLAVVLFTVPFPAEQAALGDAVRGFGAMTLLGSIGLLAFLIVLHLRTGAIAGWADKILAIGPASLREKAVAALKRFAAGLTIMGRPRALIAVTAMGVAIWMVNLVPVILTGLAFKIHTGFFGGLFIMVIGAAAASIPAAPGFIGTFHSFTQQAVVFITHTDPAAALSFAIVLHACYYFPMTLAGAVAAYAKGYSLTRLQAEARAEEEKN
jgi:hypothetical protein